MYRRLKRKLSACIRHNDSMMAEKYHDDCENSIDPTIESEDKNVSINILDDDCLLKIFSYLPTCDIFQLERVCHRWEDLCDILWRSIKFLACDDDTWYVNDRNKNLHQSYMGKGRDHLVETLEKCKRFIEEFDLRLNSYSAVLLLTAVTQNCENLLYININTDLYPIRLCEQQLCQLLDSSTKLKSFSIDGDYSSCPIFITYGNVNNEIGSFLPYLSVDTLERIYIGDMCNDMKFFLIAALREFKCLRSFECVGKVDYDRSLVEAIMSNESLENLHLSFTECRLPNLVISLLTNLSKLKNLTFSYVHITNNDLIAISNNCEQLESLDVRGCTRITDLGISRLVNLTKLKILNVTGLYAVTDEPIGNLSNTLTTLECISCERVTDYGIVKLIRRAPNLKYLDLTGCPITNVTIQAAIETITKRENGIKLKIIIRHNPNVDINEFMELPPLLKIVGVNKIK